VSAASTYSTREVRALSRQQRQCLFEDEQTLGNSSNGTGTGTGGYSYSNCLVQCRVEHMDRLCHCAPYFYPSGGRAPALSVALTRRSNRSTHLRRRTAFLIRGIQTSPDSQFFITFLAFYCFVSFLYFYYFIVNTEFSILVGSLVAHP
jgi:hypothetical protein